MPEERDFSAVSDPALLRAEIVRQGKVIRALVNRAERLYAPGETSDFAVFQSTVTFEDLLQRRTGELTRVLRDNERMTRSLRESEAMLRTIINQPLVGISVIVEGRLVFANSKLADIFGYAPEEAQDLELTRIVVEEDQAMVLEHARRRLSRAVVSANYTFRGVRKDGVVIDVEVFGTVIEFRGRLALLSVYLDVTERLRAERDTAAFYAQLEDQSNRDGLTGLFNRRYFDAALAREMGQARLGRHSLTLALCDLDHFKGVNDRFGHVAGDKVLRAFAGELLKVCKARDLACRVGGEEFALLVPRTSGETAFGIIETVRQAVATAAVAHGDTAIRYTFSCGLAVFPGDGTTPERLLVAADEALYAAKGDGRDRTVLRGKTASPRQRRVAV